jgi:hypothetical protein
MSTQSTSLPDEKARRVFREIRLRKAMPLLEIAALTGVRGRELKETIDQLAADELVTLQGEGNPATTIVSLSDSLQP